LPRGAARNKVHLMRVMRVRVVGPQHRSRP
jgi:hypothetical protein